MPPGAFVVRVQAAAHGAGRGDQSGAPPISPRNVLLSSLSATSSDTGCVRQLSAPAYTSGRTGCAALVEVDLMVAPRCRAAFADCGCFFRRGGGLEGPPGGDFIHPASGWSAPGEERWEPDFVGARGRRRELGDDAIGLPALP